MLKKELFDVLAHSVSSVGASHEGGAESAMRVERDARAKGGGTTERSQKGVARVTKGVRDRT